MDATRGTARIVGALFITATAASLVSTALLSPVADSPISVGRVLASKDEVALGVVFQLLAAFASAAIAIWLYPVLRRHHESLALAAVGFRVIEAVMYIAGIAGVLSLLTLGDAAPGGAGSQTLSALLPASRNAISVLAVVAFGVGAMMYYSIFFRSGLIPRWLSGWGLVGAALVIAAGLLVILQLTSFFSTVQVLMSVPIGLQEMVLAVWLIVIGFDVPAVATASAGRS
jgi:hypothetical protein